MTKIYVYPADVYGCGYYRLIWPAQELIKQGYDVTLVMPSERNNLAAEIQHDKLVNVRFPEDADILVMQRVTHKYLTDAIPMIRSRGCSVVVDMDDDMSNIHPHNPAWINFHPKTYGVLDNKVVAEHNWGNALRACESASLVTLSANALIQRYAKHGRGVVLRNCVPTSYLDIPHEDSNVIGWGGSLASHPDDLGVMGMSITRLQREGVPFKIVGDPGRVQKYLLLDEEPLSTGIVDIDEWPKALSTLGIGVTPLYDSVFNASKSWLKPLEYAALGVPMVLSPRAEYKRFQKELGVGLLAKNGSSDWYRKLRRLTDSPSLRQEMSARGRIAASYWTYEARAKDWADAWLSAVNYDH